MVDKQIAQNEQDKADLELIKNKLGIEKVKRATVKYT